jgi:signal transduction histidine kinase
MTDAEALSRRLAGRTALAWVLGVVLLAGLAVGMAHRGHQGDLDAALRGHALAVYGLGYFDDAGRYQDEFIRMEPELLDGDVAISVVTDEGVVYGEPVADAGEMLQAVREVQWFVPWASGPEAVVALPAYDEQDAIKGVIITRAPARQAWDRTLRFAGVTGATMLGLILVGLVLSRRLSHQLLKALAAQMAERERVMAGAAHELRTPLATLLAIADTTAPHEAADALPKVRETVVRAAGTVDRLLTWSRLAEAELELAPVRLDLLTELCLAESDPLEAEATVVRGDARLLEVAVGNLVENARKHGGGLRAVTVASGTITVRDHGPGITDPGLLAPFTKGAASRGSGLGLALVRRIVDKHGGSLEITPEIRIRLPIVEGT